MKNLFLESGSEPREAAEAAGHLGLAIEKLPWWAVSLPGTEYRKKMSESSRTAVWRGLGLERARLG